VLICYLIATISLVTWVAYAWYVAVIDPLRGIGVVVAGLLGLGEGAGDERFLGAE